MRLFIAIQLDGNIKDALTAVQKTLRVNRVGGNYTKIENLHLTLAFIGEYGDPNRVLEVIRTVPEASMTAERISLMRSERGKNGMIYTELGNNG